MAVPAGANTPGNFYPWFLQIFTEEQCFDRGMTFGSTGALLASPSYDQQKLQLIRFGLL
jgi:hypothetical protein